MVVMPYKVNLRTLSQMPRTISASGNSTRTKLLSFIAKPMRFWIAFSRFLWERD
jgi:hypothetical protein